MLEFNGLFSDRNDPEDIEKHSVRFEPLNCDASDAQKKVFLYVAKYSTKKQDGFDPKHEGYIQYNVPEVDINGEICQRESEIIGDKHSSDYYQYLTGKQWGKVGFPKIQQKEESAIISGHLVSRYLHEIHGDEPNSLGIMRRFHIFEKDEIKFFIEWLKKNRKRGKFQITDDME